MKTKDLIAKLQTIIQNFPKAADLDIQSEAGDYGHMDIYEIRLETGKESKVVIETGL